MTSGQKIAFSLLAALALFAVFVLSLNSRLFKMLETRFYAQSKIEENTGQLDKISESCDSYISEILSLVEKGDNAWTKNASVRSYYVQNPSESDVNTRRKLTETLFSDIPALSGIRIVDKNGRNVHYSSYDDTDLLKQSGISKIYKNYNDIIKDAGEIPFEQLQKITSETKTVLLCDESRSRLIISVPFCWVDGIYSGIALFYLNLNEVENELIRRDVVSKGRGLTLYSDDDYNGGFVLDIPRGTKNEFRTPFISYWKARSEVLRGGDAVQQPQKLLAMPDGRYYVSLSSNRIGKIRISSVYTSDIFELSAEIRILIYICIFISILLVVFLIFSFIRDPMVTLQKRIKKIQLEIVENYIDGKEKREWNDVARHLRQRRNDLSDEIIKSLPVHSKKRRKELSDYLEKNWEDIFAIFESKAGESTGTAGTPAAANASGTAELTGASIAEIRRMLEEVLQNRNIVMPVAAAGAGVVAGAAVSAVKAVKTPVQADEVEELDDVDELDDAEELDEVEELTDDVEDLAEDVDEIDEVEDLDEEPEVIDEVEEVTEEPEVIDEVEELAEEADTIDEAEPVEELAEDVEELSEEAEVTDEVEELAEENDVTEEVKEVSEEVEEELEDADEVEELDEIEELDELDEVDEELEALDEEEQEEKSERIKLEAYLKSLVAPERKYRTSNETFFASEKFPTVENLYAEELKLGDFSPYFVSGSDTIDIKLYPIPEYNQPEVAETAQSETAPQENQETPVEELTEEIPDYLPEPDFSMISFGENIDQEIPELEDASAESNKTKEVIVENDGVFSISEGLEYSGVVQDADFKKLVDSIL